MNSYGKGLYDSSIYQEGTGPDVLPRQQSSHGSQPPDGVGAALHATLATVAGDGIQHEQQRLYTSTSEGHRGAVRRTIIKNEEEENVPLSHGIACHRPNGGGECRTFVTSKRRKIFARKFFAKRSVASAERGKKISPVRQ